MHVSLTIWVQCTCSGHNTVVATLTILVQCTCSGHNTVVATLTILVQCTCSGHNTVVDGALLLINSAAYDAILEDAPDQDTDMSTTNMAVGTDKDKSDGTFK